MKPKIRIEYSESQGGHYWYLYNGKIIGHWWKDSKIFMDHRYNSVKIIWLK
jgi:hypothetical protein